MEAIWHCLSTSDALTRLGVSGERGLSAREAAERRQRFGANAIREQAPRSRLQMLLGQFTDFMILVLLVGRGRSRPCSASPRTPWRSSRSWCSTPSLGFVQEYRAERAMAALQAACGAERARASATAPTSTIPAADLVPGDIVLLEAGNVVPADVRLSKRRGCGSRRRRSPANRCRSRRIPRRWPRTSCRSATAEHGLQGHLVPTAAAAGVVATGMATELGRIAELLADDRRGKTPLQRRLAEFGKRLSVAALAICAVVFALGLLRGEAPLLMFLTAVSLAVAAIPEALPAVVTISLALGAQRMVKKNALIRRLPAVETLGSVTFICSDKTGTLTAEPDARRSVPGRDGAACAMPRRRASRSRGELCSRALALCNDAVHGRGGEVASATRPRSRSSSPPREAGDDKAALGGEHAARRRAPVRLRRASA